MPRYNYTARTAAGEVIASNAEAESLPTLAAKLAAEGASILTAKEESEGLPRIRGIAFFEVIAIYRQIASSIEAGLPLMETLEMLSGESRNMRLKSLLYFLKSQVGQGIPLSDAMSRFPAAFPAVHIAVVKSGEECGQLAEAMNNLADQAETFSNMNRRFASALVYPAVVCSFAILLLSFVSIGVVPKFLDLFKDLGIERYSTFTQLVFFLSRLVVPVAILLILAAIILTTLVLGQKRAASGRLWLDAWQLRIPIVGQIIEKSALARFSGMLGLLLNSGVDLPRAVRLASAGAGNKTVEHILKNLSSEVELGISLSESIDRTGTMPPTLAWRVGVGEETGTLPDALLKMSRLYTKQVDSLVTSLAGVVEPTMIVVLGCGVALLIIGLFLPLASVINSLTGLTS